MLFYFLFFFFSSRRRHTRCALVTGVQTCAHPISLSAYRRLDRAGAGAPQIRADAGLNDNRVGRVLPINMRENVATPRSTHYIGPLARPPREGRPFLYQYPEPTADRKRDVQGKLVSERVANGGGRIITKKIKQ